MEGSGSPQFLSRRQLLVAGAASLSLAATGATPSPSGAQLPAAPALEPATDSPIAERSLRDLAAALASGAITSRELVHLYRERIERLDHQGPELHALLELNPDAERQADALDAERAAGKVRGPLHGLPILLKDNIAADGMETTAGSLALLGTRPRDAAIVARLRAAGAVLLGKTNLSEWANFRSTHSSSGWSGRGGQCRNPYALDRSPSGSSSGSAVGVAASLAAAAVGTETDGSIVSPSASCGIVGIKPTVGLLSRSGIIPISHSQDTAGPMARTVADAALLLAALAGSDPTDAASRPTPAALRGNLESLFDAGALRGARIGVARKHYFGDSPAADHLIEGSLAALRDAGAVLIDPADLDTSGGLGESEMDVLLFEFKTDLNRYLSELGPQARVKSLADLIAWNEKHAREEMPFFGQELFVRAEACGPLTETRYQKALAQCRKIVRTEGLDATFRKHRLDALVAPTSGPAWLIDLVNGDSGVGGSSTPAAVAGYPSITVPAGFVAGLPIGLSFMGLPMSEPALIRFAYAFEQNTRARRPPQYRPTVGLSPAAAG
jgi:amidase